MHDKTSIVSIKKEAILSVIVLVIATAGSLFFYRPSQAMDLSKKNIRQLSKQTIDKYVTDKTAQLAAQAKKNADGRQPAEIVFKKFIDEKEVKEMIVAHHLNASQLMIGWDDNTGAYTFEPGDTLEIAFEKASQGQQDFLNNVLRVETQPELRQKFLSYQAAYQKYGLTFFGIKATGSNKDLYELKTKNPDIQLVDTDLTGRSRFVIPFSPHDYQTLSQ